MELIPSIDLRQGRVVRLLKGDDGQRTVYDADPVATLLAYGRAGAGLVHIVDLDAAFGEDPQRELIETLVQSPAAPSVQLGGGLRDRESIQWAFDVGVSRAVTTSLLVRDFDVFSSLAYSHPQRMVAALDIERDELKLAGWTETAKKPWREVAAEIAAMPLGAVLVTDIERDGTLQGPNVELARSVAEAASAPGLLSGGVRELDDLRRASAVPQIAGAIVGKALYDGAFTVAEAVAACRGEEVA